ncbi:hypothetical protein [Parasitella parasitica]|uniref:DUF3835 domain-containing protein n=1 Tax=Parasitella parasitica TaxID=35722 RepID=A0A0B7MXW3_9FUNG|nr:hypothetical protein [Parasitella parasitica]
MTDLTDQINLIASKLSNQLSALEQEYQRWSDYKTDYDALENQLKTLPDSTTKSAMIPMGRFAFMPGKLIHTNEILVLLGDQYYAERSAKQAVEILGRRRQVVEENLRLAEAQLNSFKAKKNSLVDAGALSTDPQLNEEGLPIMEIREPIDEKAEEMKKKKMLDEKKKSPKQPINQLPESVLRARRMMEEADNQKKTSGKDNENKALFDLLKELEEEEEGEAVEQGHQSTVVPGATAAAAKDKKNTQPSSDDEDSDELTDEFSDDKDDDDDRYDTEISENMFDRFGDDEQYALDGVVDQEDFTCYDELPPQVPLAAPLREIVDDEDEELYEKSTPKVITKKKVQQQAADKDKASTPKPMSRFKLAQQEKKNNQASVKESSPLKQEIVTESEAALNEAPKKKFSKFKLLRQEQRQRPANPVTTSDVKESAPIPVIPAVFAATTPIKNEIKKEEEEEEEEAGLMPNSSSKANQGIPQVKSGSKKPKKMSRFKLQSAQSKQETPSSEPDTAAPLVAKKTKPKRSVTWDATTDVRDHDYYSAPSDVAETPSYSQPMKTESKKPLLKRSIQSPADIFNTIKFSQGEIVDDYPSLDDDNEVNGKQVDLNELIQVARSGSEAFYRPNDGSEALISMFKSFNDEEGEEEEEEETPNGIIVARKNKMDNKIMKGAVMERDVAPVDLEKVEDDMDLREITSSYQQKRQNMLAATGGFSFAPKPEFEVIDEDLPLPKKKNDNQEEQPQATTPKKMSRFKAARLGMKMDTAEDENY